jgi:polar amino acid transport system substrate-binding protein
MFKLRSLVFILMLIIVSMAYSQETITMVAGETFPPLMWNDNGIPRGVAIEVGKAILENAGYKVRVVTCPWMRCQIMAEKEGAFLTGFSRNAERQKLFIFSDVVMYDDLVIVTKKGKEFSLDNPKEYKGKRIGAQVGVGFGENNQAKKEGMIIETDVNDVLRVKKIMNGRVDGGFFSLGSVGINYSAKLAGIPMSNFTILPSIVSKDPNYMATGKNTPGAKEKIKRINKAIKILTKRGEFAKILKMQF